VHLVQRALVQVDQVAQAVLAPSVQVGLAAQVAQAEIVLVVLVDLVPQEPVVVLVDLVRQAQAAVLLVLVHQVELQAQPLAADQVDVRTQLAVVATQQAHLESQVADHLRVASQSVPSVKSSTT
jgi:G3E family GTPase